MAGAAAGAAGLAAGWAAAAAAGLAAGWAAGAAAAVGAAAAAGLAVAAGCAGWEGAQATIEASAPTAAAPPLNRRNLRLLIVVAIASLLGHSEVSMVSSCEFSERSRIRDAAFSLELAA